LIDQEGEREESKKEERLTGGSSTGKSWLDSDRDYSYDEVKTKSCPYYTILHISHHIKWLNI
jgi:hypothetical protein